MTRVRSILTAAGVGLFALGCIPPENQRLNAPPQGESNSRPEWSQYYTYHNDQGMLADMSVADIHFVPHCSELSGTGQARLARYAELLAARGGTINYETSIENDKLIRDRLAVAKRFLVQALPGKQQIDVVPGIAGGRGMDAKEGLAGQAIAKQAETRKNAYHLNVKLLEGQ